MLRCFGTTAGPDRRSELGSLSNNTESRSIRRSIGHVGCHHDREDDRGALDYAALTESRNWRTSAWSATKRSWSRAASSRVSRAAVETAWDAPTASPIVAATVSAPSAAPLT